MNNSAVRQLEANTFRGLKISNLQISHAQVLKNVFFLKADGDHNMIPKMDLPEKHKFVQLSKIDPEAFRGLEDTLQVGIFTI